MTIFRDFTEGDVRRSKPFPYICILLLLGRPCLAQKSGQPSATERETDRRLFQIDRSIKDNHVLANADKKFLLNQIDHPTFGTGQMQLLLLVDAAHQNLFPLKDLLEIIERKARGNEAIWTVYPAFDYYAALKPTSHTPSTSVSRRYNALVDKKKDPTRLDDEEKRFVVQSLALASSDDNVIAAWVGLQKHRLDKTSMQWLKDKFTAQEEKSDKLMKLFWSFVVRIMNHRNPAVKTSGQQAESKSLAITSSRVALLSSE